MNSKLVMNTNIRFKFVECYTVFAFTEFISKSFKNTLSDANYIKMSYMKDFIHILLITFDSYLLVSVI